MRNTPTTVVCVSASERTWRNLERYCFNAVFRAQRSRFALAVGFNGKDTEGLRFIDRLEPDHLLLRPNTGHDLANFDNILKGIPAYEEYILLHDDHWFYDAGWFDVLRRLLDASPEIGVWGNLVPFDVAGPFLDYYTTLLRALGYEEMIGKRYPHFLQGLAGIYRGRAIEEVLAMDGIPHLHRSIQVAAQVCERLFSGLLLERGLAFGQIPPGYELYLLHKDHSIIKAKLQEAAEDLARGDTQHARDITDTLLDLRPDDPDLAERIRRMFGHEDPPVSHPAQTWYARAVELRGRGELEGAVRAYREALTCQPGNPELLYNLGNVLTDLGRPAEAVQVYGEAAATEPHLHGLYNNFGLALEATGDRPGALRNYTRALREAPDYAPAHINLGLALLKEGRLEEAEASCRQAVACDPCMADARYNLAGVLLERDLYEEADSEFAEALRLNPAFAEAWVNRGIGYLHMERSVEAIDAFRHAIAIRPEFPEAHLNLAVALLQLGAYREGWEEYRWRFRTGDRKNPRRFPGFPEWDGESLEGRTVLVYQEQGLGDVVQCLRFLPRMIEQGGRIVVASQSVLHPLLTDLPVEVRALGDGEDAAGVDEVCPVFNLPRIFDVTSETIPATIPYLSPPGSVERWRRVVGQEHGTLRVGLAWTGNPAHSNNRRRSLSRAALEALLGTPGVVFHSLHRETDSPDGLQRYGDRLGDLGEVAALMCTLDLVITVDTAFAHIAGALGVPVWLLLNRGGDWRWMLHRQDSPWYPTMRIFRQSSPGDWEGVVERVRVALGRVIAGGIQ